MRVLADLHHGALYHSLRMLFERRLGGTVLRPVGMDWFDAGHWSYPFYARDTAAQFLGPAYDHPGVTLPEFLDTWRSFRLMLSSTPEQFHAWEAMRKKHGITIPHVWQSGNRWDVPEGCRFFLNSTTVPAPPGCHEVRYHQEFSLEEYCPLVARPGRVISSFMHYQRQQERQGWFDALQAEMPTWRFNEYGAGGRDGQPDDLASAMRLSRYLYHGKIVEGYGFNVHYAAACGIPIIMRVARNAHEACGAFLRTGETCLDVDDYASPGHLADAIRRFDENYEDHSLAMRARFLAVVDFDDEERRIRKWLEGVT